MPNESLHTWAKAALHATLKRCFCNAIADCEREAAAGARLAAELRERAREAGWA